jgi:putative peptidoglycan lipid II flippase
VRTIIAPGFDPDLVRLTANLMRYMLISTVIFSLSGLIMSILNAFEHFLMPALAPVMYNLGILFGALFLVPIFGIYGLAFGVVLGALAHAAVQIPMLRHFGIRYSPILALRDPVISASVRRVARLMGPRMVGAAVVQLMFLANTIIASFYNPSVLAALNYAWIVMLLPHGVFASSVATAIFPTFSQMAAVGNREGMRRGMAQTLRALLFVVIPASVGLFVLRVPIIQVLFERGVFTHEATLSVAWALAFYAPGLIAHSLIEIINRAFFALQDTLTPVIVGAGAMIGTIVLSLLLIPVIGDPASLVRGPQGALALANTLASIAEVPVLLWLLRRHLGGLGGRALVGSVLRLGAAAGAMGVVLWLLQQWPTMQGLPVLLFTPLAVAVAGAVYLFVTWLLGVEETRLIPRILLRRRVG